MLRALKKYILSSFLIMFLPALTPQPFLINTASRAPSQLKWQIPMLNLQQWLALLPVIGAKIQL